MTQHEQTIRAECEKRGISVTQQGIGWKLRGAGVDLSTAGWQHVRLADLQPPVAKDGTRSWS